MDTDLLSVAEGGVSTMRSSGAENRDTAPTVRQALDEAVADKADDPEVSPNTATYYRHTAGTMLRTFPDPDTRIDKVKPADMELWMRAPSKAHAATPRIHRADRIPGTLTLHDPNERRLELSTPPHPQGFTKARAVDRRSSTGPQLTPALEVPAQQDQTQKVSWSRGAVSG